MEGPKRDVRTRLHSCALRGQFLTQRADELFDEELEGDIRNHGGRDELSGVESQPMKLHPVRSEERRVGKECQ